MNKNTNFTSKLYVSTTHWYFDLETLSLWNRTFTLRKLLIDVNTNETIHGQHRVEQLFWVVTYWWVVTHYLMVVEFNEFLHGETH